MTVNILKTSADGPRPRVPYYGRLRAALEQTDLDGACKALGMGLCAGSLNVIPAQDCTAVDVEDMPHGAHAVEPERGLLAHSSHCVASALPDDVGPQIISSIRTCLDRARELFVGHGLGWCDLRAVVTNHAAGIDAVCRHAGPEPACLTRRQDGVQRDHGSHRGHVRDRPWPGLRERIRRTPTRRPTA